MAELFVALEPLAKKRVVRVTKSRKAVDFARFVLGLVDIQNAHSGKIVLVMDNLNIYGIASLCKAFEQGETSRIAKKFELHHISIYTSRLNMDEIEIGVLSHQFLTAAMTSIKEMSHEVAAWQCWRNATHSP